MKLIINSVKHDFSALDNFGQLAFFSHVSNNLISTVTEKIEKGDDFEIVIAIREVD